MLYTVYKTTNLVNGKFYIGTHKTLDPNDDYLGSGTLLKKAIEKYGRDNFVKEVLFVFDNPVAMFAKEAEIVTAEFLAENNTYNLKLGGEGGFDYLNSSEYENPTRSSEHIAKMTEARKKLSPEVKARISEAVVLSIKGFPRTWKTPGFLGKQHSQETKLKLSNDASLRMGSKNSQYGSMWITDGASNKKIKKGDQIPEGWSSGRTCS